ncbi:Crp/Fnr family transcriptional regulator [Ancylothrix sp. C2]|uniref:Crp/Fnr family transcriptional regulator n=1 Tax=Ancylothrix sp. D3o TaxID=2953691 RepID=UPI0021BB51E6|nr:Crp/Fnr family transcriptional regulator [Ancylothrix sp. D3o]MCT7951945.1 Crp/Fnr family transcriptional regulator [Ancylothrix sp. D3o]
MGVLCSAQSRVNQKGAFSGVASTLSSGRLPSTFAVGDVIPLWPEVVWKIERGAVRAVTWSEEGRPVILGYWGVGDIVSGFLLPVEPCQVECVKATELSRVPLNLMERGSEAMILQLKQAQELLAIVRCERAYLRLLNFLIWLAKKFGEEVETGRQIELRLTHQEIAEAIGMARVTVTRLLQKFEREGIICRPQGKTIVLKQM